MVFSSLLFLFRFLPIVLLAYYVLPKKWHNLVLFLASLVFYAWGEPVYVILILFSTTVDYVAGQAVAYCKANQKKKGAIAAVCCSAVINLSLLGFFKYADFFLQILHQVTGIKTGQLHLPLPIGISFYTFQTMSYTIDVYRGDAKVQKNLITFGAYVSLFPQLIAGPIIRYKDVAKQLDQRKETVSLFSQGIFRFMIGLGKKVLIANQIGMLWQQIAAMKTGSLTTATAWLGVLAFTLQIYFDFSGYSDMAIGLGLMFGFHFVENFNYPYIAKTATEFWRRWHISLSTWFREYLYIPLGGNRCSKPRWMFNLLVVWAATGIWHGASWNYLIWGLYFFVLLMVEKFFLLDRLSRAPAAVGHVYTMFFVLVSWAIFAIEDAGHLAGYLRVMFGLGGVPLADPAFGYYLTSYLPILCVAGLASTPLGASLYRRLKPRTAQAVCAVLVLAGLVVCTAYLVDGTYNPFLYFRF